MPFFLIILLLAIVSTNLNAETPWGPKFMLQFKNEVGQTARTVIGVDKNATDDYDDDVLFQFENTTLKENSDLPPFPMALSVYLIRDTLKEFDSYTYVDMRGISADKEQFRHRYNALIHWQIMAYPYYIDVIWGKLPAGIDSAKFSCGQGAHTITADMMATEQIRLESEVYTDITIDVWYNKNPDGIEASKQFEQQFVTPNPANEFIKINNANIKQYHIYDIAGNELNNLVSSQEETDCIIININRLYKGVYTLILEQNNGKLERFSFVKN